VEGYDVILYEYLVIGLQSAEGKHCNQCVLAIGPKDFRN
jgi:hypothetical protein